MDLLDKEHAESLIADEILWDGMAVVSRNLNKKCAAEREAIEARSRKCDVLALGDKSAVGNVPTLISLESLFTQTARMESGADDVAQDGNIGNTELEMGTELPSYARKQLLAALTYELIKRAAIGCEKGNLHIKFFPIAAKSSVDDGGVKREKVDIVRKDIHLKNDNGVNLPFFGRVVEEVVAERLPRAIVMKLTPSPEFGEYEGPVLYIDGNQHLNPKRTDCCIAFLVGVLPKEKDTPIATSDKTMDGTEPEKKRVRKTTLTGEKFSPIATHLVTRKPLVVEIAMNDDRATLRYDRPDHFKFKC